jgi:hypothetical protein
VHNTNSPSVLPYQRGNEGPAMENEGNRRNELRRAPAGWLAFRRVAGRRLHGPWRAHGRRGGGAGCTAALGLGLMLCGSVANGQVTEASSTTVLRLQPDWAAGDKNNSFWATEYVTLSLRPFDVPGVQDLQLQLSAWGQAVTNSDGGMGDIDLWYLQGSVLDRHLTFTIGRQLIVGGAAKVFPLDGLNLTYVSNGGFGVSAYVGAPTAYKLTYPIGDFAFGARAFWRPTFGTEVGVSFIEVLNQGVVARQNLGVDARVAILPTLSATASADFSLAADRFVDAELTVSWHVLPTLELSVKAQQSEPDLYLPLTSIFTVFANTERTGVGGGIFWQALQRLSFFGNYEFLWVDGGTGNDVELGVTYKIARKSTVGFNCHLLFEPSNGYTDLRVWALQSLTEHIRLSADLDWVLLQNPVVPPASTQQASLLGTLSATWAVGSGWSLMLSSTVGSTPLNQTEFTVTGKVGYDFYSMLGGAKAPQ